MTPDEDFGGYDKALLAIVLVGDETKIQHTPPETIHNDSTV